MSASAIPECQVLMMRLKDDLLVAARRRRRRPARAYVGALARRRGADRGDGREGLSRHVREGHGDPRPRRGRQPRASRSSTPAPRDATATARRQWRPRAQRHGVGQNRRPRRSSRAYAAVDRIDWPDGFCRRDIGWRAVERERYRPPLQALLHRRPARRACVSKNTGRSFRV